MKHPHRSWLILMIGLALASLACGTSGLPFGGSPTAEPTITPPGDTLTLTVPLFTTNLEPGETIPGTQLTYVGATGDAYNVRINNLPATKRVGDSFLWDGIIAPGVFATFNLRLTRQLFGGMPVAGPVELIVLSPQPQELATLPAEEPRLRFTDIVINYRVPVGHQVPGTTLVYEGLSPSPGGSTDQGQFSGGQGFPYFLAGDSLVWTGQLRDNVYLRYNLRALTVSEEDVRLVGTAELIIN